MDKDEVIKDLEDRLIESERENHELYVRICALQQRLMDKMYRELQDAHIKIHQLKENET